MNRLDFIKSLGALAGVAFIPEAKPEKLTISSSKSNVDMNIGVERMRITSNGNVGMAELNPNQILEVIKRVNGGMSPLYKRIK
jgi:hypothetical protein